MERRLEKLENQIEALRAEMHKLPVSEFDKLQQLDAKMNLNTAEYEEIFDKLSELEG